jgi:hypothetical protein
VLCRVGSHRLAFPAVEVVSIGAWSPGGAAIANLRSVLGLPPVPGKALMGPEGEGLVVDGLEIHGEPTGLLPVSPMLRQVAGKSLAGFALVDKALWPIFHFADLSHFLIPTPR